MSHFSGKNNHNLNTNNPGNSNQNAGNQERNSLAAQWAALTPQQQQLLYIQQQNVLNNSMNPQQRNQFQQQSTLEQYLVQQQWIQQQLMASYGSQLYSAGPTLPMPDHSSTATSGVGKRGRNYGRDRHDRHHPYQGNRNDSKQGNHTQKDHRHRGSRNNSPQPPSASKPVPPPPPRSLMCEACDQKFSGKIGYEAHLQAHKQCPFCAFSALSKPLNQHIAKEHSDAKKIEDVGAKGKGVEHDERSDVDEEVEATMKKIGQSIESPEDIAAWIEARKKKYPSTANVKLKEEEEKLKEELLKQEEPLKKVHNPTSFKVCKFYQKGKCKMMEDCPYQHSIPLNKPTASAAASAQKAKSAVSSSQSSPKPVKELLLTKEEQLLLDAIKFICKENMMGDI